MLSWIDGFTEKFRDYLLEPQVLFSYVIDVVLSNKESLNIFIDFLADWKSKNLIPIFNRIKLPVDKEPFDDKIILIYDILKSMAADQENVLTKNWLVKKYSFPLNMKYTASVYRQEYNWILRLINFLKIF